MSDIQTANIASILTDSLLLTDYKGQTASDKLQEIKNRLQNLPSVLDKTTLEDLKDGKYEITLKQYTSMNTYNTMMNALYGDKSADKFQNFLNIFTDSQEDGMAKAKSFIDKLREQGMSNSGAIRTYAALQKYSILSSYGNNYNFVNAKA